MSIKIKKLNNESVKPVKFRDDEEDTRPVKGKELFSEVYGNIFFMARKKSGKTCAIYHIIDKCSTTETRVIAFVSTLHRDPTWKAIQDLCEHKKIPFTGFTSIKDEHTKEDILNGIVRALEAESHEKEKEDLEPPKATALLLMDGDPTPGTKKAKPPKEKAPKIIFVFDDLSGELQTASLTELLKKNRHFKCKTIISTQYWNDLARLQARKQVDYAILYKGLAQSPAKLMEVYSNLDLPVQFETFMDIYRFCTSQRFHFMFIDVVNGEFRLNFTHQLVLKNDDERDL